MNSPIEPVPAPGPERPQGTVKSSPELWQLVSPTGVALIYGLPFGTLLAWAEHLWRGAADGRPLTGADVELGPSEMFDFERVARTVRLTPRYADGEPDPALTVTVTVPNRIIAGWSESTGE